jgi:hypothetical protein
MTKKDLSATLKLLEFEKDQRRIFKNSDKEEMGVVRLGESVYAIQNEDGGWMIRGFKDVLNMVLDHLQGGHK